MRLYVSYAGLLNTIAGLATAIVMFFAMAHRPRLESTILRNHISLCGSEAIVYAQLLSVMIIAGLISIAFLDTEIFKRLGENVPRADMFRIFLNTGLSAGVGVLVAFSGYLFDGTLYFAILSGTFVLNALNLVNLLWIFSNLRHLMSQSNAV